SRLLLLDRVTVTGRLLVLARRLSRRGWLLIGRLPKRHTRGEDDAGDQRNEIPKPAPTSSAHLSRSPGFLARDGPEPQLGSPLLMPMAFLHWLFDACTAPT